MRLEHEVCVVTFGKRLQPLVDGLLVALCQESGITVARVPDAPLVGVFEVVASRPGEALEVTPIADHLPCGSFNVAPVDAVARPHGLPPYSVNFFWSRSSLARSAASCSSASRCSYLARMPFWSSQDCNAFSTSE